MASNAAFTVNDGTNDHVFSPTGIKDGRIATYANQAESMISGRETAVLSQKADSKTVREVVLTTRIPRVVEETINGVTRRKVDNFGSMSSKLLVPVDWTDEEVEVLRKTHAGSLAVTPYTKAADEAEFVW
jgi:hypothetical protein